MRVKLLSCGAHRGARPVGQHVRDGLLPANRDVPEDDLVVLVPGSGEVHRRAVLDLDLRRQRQRDAIGDEGHVGDAEHARWKACTRWRWWGRPRPRRGRRRGRGAPIFQRRLCEAATNSASVCRSQLGGSARTLGEHHEQSLVSEQALRVLRQSRELARPRRPEVHEGVTRFMNFSTMPCARRGGSISSRHEAMTIAPSILMPPNGCRRRAHRAPLGGDVTDAARLHAEVVAVHRGERGEGAPQVLARDAVGIELTRRRAARGGRRDCGLPCRGGGASDCRE